MWVAPDNRLPGAAYLRRNRVIHERNLAVTYGDQSVYVGMSLGREEMLSPRGTSASNKVNDLRRIQLGQAEDIRKTMFECTSSLS